MENSEAHLQSVYSVNLKKLNGRYILGQNKMLLNDHILNPTALELKPFSDSEFKFWKQKN